MSNRINFKTTTLLSLIFLFLTLLVNQDVSAKDYFLNDSNPDYLIAVNNINDMNRHMDESEFESPLRRFEITFIISLPFVFLANFLVLHLADVIILRDPNVDVWENHGPFLALNTIMITSIISYREAGIISEINKVRTSSVLERKIYLSYTENY